MGGKFYASSKLVGENPINRFISLPHAASLVIHPPPLNLIFVYLIKPNPFYPALVDHHW